VESTTKGAHDYYFTMVGSQFRELDNIWEKLSLVNANDIVIAPVIA
jgi:hypothetical protein